LLAAFTVLLNVTACSQSRPDIFDFTYEGVKYVGIKAATWEQMVANRLGSNQLNRERAQSIGLLRSDVEAEKAKATTYTKDVEDAKKRESEAWKQAETCKDENGSLQRKVKRLRPWATLGKVTVAVGVVGLTVAGIELMKSSVE
jgi:FtsZ-binding cell division protein ZapB